MEHTTQYAVQNFGLCAAESFIATAILLDDSCVASVVGSTK